MRDVAAALVLLAAVYAAVVVLLVVILPALYALGSGPTTAAIVAGLLIGTTAPLWLD
jgi:hypothetical protein